MLNALVDVILGLARAAAYGATAYLMIQIARML